jgi:hypothetical protein
MDSIIANDEPFSKDRSSGEGVQKKASCEIPQQDAE